MKPHSVLLRSWHQPWKRDQRRKPMRNPKRLLRMNQLQLLLSIVHITQYWLSTADTWAQPYKGEKYVAGNQLGPLNCVVGSICNPINRGLPPTYISILCCFYSTSNHSKIPDTALLSLGLLGTTTVQGAEKYKIWWTADLGMFSITGSIDRNVYLEPFVAKLPMTFVVSFDWIISG